MAINTLYTVTLTEQQISYVLGQIEGEYGWNTGKKAPDYLEEMFSYLEGEIDKVYDKLEAAKKKQPKAEWQPLKCNPIEYKRIMNTSDLLCDLYDIRRMAELEGFGDLPKDNEGTETTIFECLDNCITQLLEEQRNENCSP